MQNLLPRQVRNASPPLVQWGNGGNPAPYTGAQVVVSVFTITGAGVTPQILGWGPAGGWYPILSPAVITSTGTYVYRISPALMAQPGLVAQDFLPPTFGVQMTHGDGANVSYSVDVNLLP
jgi:hypothetical protein